MKSSENVQLTQLQTYPNSNTSWVFPVSVSLSWSSVAKILQASQLSAYLNQEYIKCVIKRKTKLHSLDSMDFLFRRFWDRHCYETQQTDPFQIHFDKMNCELIVRIVDFVLNWRGSYQRIFFILSNVKTKTSGRDELRNANECSEQKTEVENRRLSEKETERWMHAIWRKHDVVFE